MMNNPKFKKLDEGFICKVCGAKVKPLGYTSRDHCPCCLHSIHVDISPGDRANPCKGVLRPIGIENNNKKGIVILYQCEKCKQTHKNKSANDDNYDAILSLSNYTFNDYLKKLNKQ